ncbi:MAG: rhomboid family intramembrane serine protease [Bacteroidetes bacterium]|nr:rhomboid family intramembrane serine protease [Bacteroidota bacterium]
MIFPVLFVILLWLIRIADALWDMGMNEYGLIPLKAAGLIGIISAPLLHAGFSHLFANTIPLLVLGSLLFYFYRPLAWKIFFLIWLMTGLWVWVFARGNAAHIGASGIIYGLASFLFLSGIIRREQKLMIITLLVTFLYGSLLWGLFPQFFPKEHISWDSHLMGLLSGVLLAIYYRKSGPQKKVYEWNDEEVEDGEDAYWKSTSTEENTEN